MNACVSPRQVTDNTSPVRPRRVILLIGDGMGLSQISSLYYQDESEPAFSSMRYIGLSMTSSAVEKVTDSAAGATALACGVSTYNGAIAVDTAQQPVASILTELAARHWRTGLIATSSVTHATPACFYAHQPYRKMAEEIAVDLLDAPVDYLAGGGLKYFTERTDDRDILSELTARDWSIIDRPESPTGIGPVIYLGADDGMPKMSEGRGDFLQRAFRGAVQHLTADDASIFLMIEGSQIDWGGHANEADYIIREMQDFNQLMHEVLRWAARDGETLVVVTADHETGGFSLAGLGEKSTSDYSQIDYRFTTGGHTATLVPVFAQGPGAEHFMGVYPIREIYTRIWRAIEGN